MNQIDIKVAFVVVTGKENNVTKRIRKKEKNMRRTREYKIYVIRSINLCP